MNDREWKAVEGALQHIYSEGADLDCDGYKVSLRLRRLDAFKNAVMVYVGGVAEGRWILEDCEERRRFLCPRRSKAWKAKDREDFRKIGKRTLQKMGIDPDAFYMTYSPWWTSFTRLRRHFEANNKRVRLIAPRPETAKGERHAA